MSETVTRDNENEEVKEHVGDNEQFEDIEAKLDFILAEIFKLDERVIEICPDIKDKVRDKMNEFFVGKLTGDKKMMKKSIRFFEFLQEINAIKYDAADALKEFYKITRNKHKVERNDFSVVVGKGLTKEEFFEIVGKQLDEQFKDKGISDDVKSKKNTFIEKGWEHYSKAEVKCNQVEQM